METLDDVLVLDAMKQDKSIAGDDRAGEPGADVALPETLRAVVGPGGDEVHLGGDAVALRAEPLRPFGGEQACSKAGDGGGCQRKESCHECVLCKNAESFQILYGSSGACGLPLNEGCSFP